MIAVLDRGKNEWTKALAYRLELCSTKCTVHGQTNTSRLGELPEALFCRRLKEENHHSLYNRPHQTMHTGCFNSQQLSKKQAECIQFNQLL